MVDAFEAVRGTIPRALFAALQHLPARQRAVLIWREVMAWSAAEAATLLDTVNRHDTRSHQHRPAAPARSSRWLRAGIEVIEPKDPRRRALLDRYMRAFRYADVDSLIRLHREEVTMEMPDAARPHLVQWSRRRQPVLRTARARNPGSCRREPAAHAVATYLHGADGTCRPWRACRTRRSPART
jgi:RNA polymerase sigma-70 factor, ECF subfamily